MDEAIFIKHGWLFLLAAVLVQALAFRSRAKREIHERPALADGYSRLMRRFLIWSTLPWILMGGGVLIGAVPDTKSYLLVHEGNPFVLGWLILVGVFNLVGFVWVFFLGGAEDIVAHPGLLRGNPTSPMVPKLVYGAMVVGFFVCVYLLFTWDQPALSP